MSKKDEKTSAEPRRFPRDAVVRSKELKRFGLSIDTLRAVLDDGHYTVAEAVAAVDQYVRSYNQ